MRALSLGVVAALMVMRAMGQESGKDSAGFVAEYCQTWLHRDSHSVTDSLSQEEGACVGKIKGVIDVVAPTPTNDFEICLGYNKFIEGFCTGRAEALTFMVRSLNLQQGYSKEANGVCLPDQILRAIKSPSAFLMQREQTDDQVVRVVARYIEGRPERSRERFEILSAEALHNTWPCNP